MRFSQRLSGQHPLSAAVMVSLVVALASLPGCTIASNSIDIRNHEAALLPAGVSQLAPSIAVAISPIRVEATEHELSFHIDNGATGTVLPNGKLLTVAHAFRDLPLVAHDEESPVVYPFFVDKNMEFGAVLEFDKAEAASADWVLMAFAPQKNSVLPVLLESPLRTRVRFDGSVRIPRGTPLYCAGFPRAPEQPGDVPPFGRALTVVQGFASRDFGPGEDIEADSATDLDMRGMSGGPIGTYDETTGVFTVVGIAVRGTHGYHFLGRPVIRGVFVASRISASVMQRMDERTPADGSIHLPP